MWRAPTSATFLPLDLKVDGGVFLSFLFRFFLFNEAKQLQFSLQSGRERLCVPCHPVLIWALMYFINKGLLSSLTVVTP